MRLLIVGGSSLGRSAIHIARAQAKHDIIGVVDDNASVGAVIEGVPYLGATDEIENLQERNPPFAVVFAIGDPAARSEVATRCRRSLRGEPPPAVVHPSVTVLGDAKIGEGCILFPGCVLGPGVSIGSYCVLNANVTIGSAALIDDFSTFGPGVNVGSEASIGRSVYVGMGAAVAQRVRIGDFSTLGALSFARTNIGPHSRSVGVPAKTSEAS